MLQGTASCGPVNNEDARTTFERVIHEVAPPNGSLLTPPTSRSRGFPCRRWHARASATDPMRTSRRSEPLPSMRTTLYSGQFAEAFRAQRLWRNWARPTQPLTLFRTCLSCLAGFTGDLRFSPYWDPLRKDPRFHALL